MMDGQLVVSDLQNICVSVVGCMNLQRTIRLTKLGISSSSVEYITIHI